MEFLAEVVERRRRYRSHESNIQQKAFSKVMGMAARRCFEREASSIASLGRHELERRIKNFRGRFRLDFTEDYLNRLSVDRLRHILLAAVMNARPHN